MGKGQRCVNSDNLIPLNKRPKEERDAIIAKGVAASVASRKNKKTLKDLAKQLLYAKSSEKEKELLESFGFSGDDIQYKGAVAMGMGLVHAIKEGDLGRLDTLMKIAGEHVDRVEVDHIQERPIIAMKRTSHATKNKKSVKKASKKKVAKNKVAKKK